MSKIKFYLNNPIIVFGILFFLSSLILLLCTHFNLPDYYTNRQLALDVANTVAVSEVSSATVGYENINYKIYNPIFQLWGIFGILLLFTLIFKINKFKKIFNIKYFEHKSIIYLFANLNYIIYAVCLMPVYMRDLDKFVYNMSADSMGIPFLGMLFSLIFFALIYYPVVNFLLYVTYNTDIKSKFYNFIYILSAIWLIVDWYGILTMKFSYLTIILNLIYLTWFTLIIYSYKKITAKRKLVT